MENLPSYSSGFITVHQVVDTETHHWYEKKKRRETWIIRKLQRNISSQYYFRLLSVCPEFRATMLSQSMLPSSLAKRFIKSRVKHVITFVYSVR